MPSVELLVKRQVDRWNLMDRAQKAPAGDGATLIQPHVTISRERGAGGKEIALALGEELGWAVLDKELVDAMAVNANIRRDILNSVDERFTSQLDVYLGSVLQGKYPDVTDYVRHLGRTLNVYLHHDPAIIVGRGANVLLRDKVGNRDFGVHVRLIAPVEWRVRGLMDGLDLSEDEAFEEMKRRDAERAQFFRAAFGLNIADPLLYDLTLNRQNLTTEEVVQAILAVLRARGIPQQTR